MAVQPVVRFMVVCEDVIIDGNQVSLMRLVLNVRSSGAAPYPRIVPELSVFAVLSDVRGVGRFGLRIVQADTSQVLFATRTQPYPLGDDPLVAFGLPIRLRNCMFPEPGLYWIQLLFEETVIAQYDLFAR